MVGTIIVHGSNGEVMAPIGGGIFMPGKRMDILVTGIIPDEDVPLWVRQALIGLTISTIFSPEQLNGAAPKGSRVAYGSEVVKTLNKASKTKEAAALERAFAEHEPDSEPPFMVFEDGSYEFLEKTR